MYLSFYRLKEQPFNLTPDPRFLFLTAGHREALAQLVYGVEQGKGFIVLTGEVGTGKTTLLHALLQKLDPSTAVAYVYNSTLPFDGLLEYALEDFGLSARGTTQAQRLFALNEFLIERRRKGLKTVLIIDEAQNLSPETLEQVRLLSNFETPTAKLLQILLVGQPELVKKLQLPELRQLRQRIGLRCVIGPLTQDETREYIRTRLHIAGARDLHLFTDDAIRRIAAYAGGIPRVVSLVCDHCLLIGYADQERRIDRKIVDEAIRYLEDGERTPVSPARQPGPARRAQTAALGARRARRPARHRRARPHAPPERRFGLEPCPQPSHRRRALGARLFGAMSKFFKALEQAERDRVRQEADPHGPTVSETFVRPEAPAPAPVGGRGGSGGSPGPRRPPARAPHGRGCPAAPSPGRAGGGPSPGWRPRGAVAARRASREPSRPRPASSPSSTGRSDT